MAIGLLYLHQSNPSTVHANLKPSNVLLGPDFESYLADYAFIPSLLLPPASPHDLVAPSSVASSSLFYYTPKSHLSKPSFTPLFVVYNFGVLFQELLIGISPFQDPVEEHDNDIPPSGSAPCERSKTTPMRTSGYMGMRHPRRS